MKVTRKIEIDTDELEIGDVIRFTLKNGEDVEAMAVDKDGDKMVFCFVDCLKDEYPMNKKNTTEGGYEKSYLRKVLNTEIIQMFPDEMVDRMSRFANGDLLKIPSEMEMFGEHIYSDAPEEETEHQWEPMKDRRNRIAYQGSKTNTYEWTWLRDVAGATLFCYVYLTGNANNGNASNTLGIRPAFQI